MKTYTKVQMMAKNAPTGSYAAGCPENRAAEGGGCWYLGSRVSCRMCEVGQ